LVLAQKAVALDDSLSGAHEGLAYAYLYKRQHEQAIAAAERTITLAPNDSEGAARLGLILNFAGRPEVGGAHQNMRKIGRCLTREEAQGRLSD